jgi:putative DNA primase/helicase
MNDDISWLDGGPIPGVKAKQPRKPKTAPDHPGLGMDDGSLITEDSVALGFASIHAKELRFDHDAGAWFRWTGVAWRREGTKLAYSYARKLARVHSAASDNFKAQLVAGKASFAAGVERFAQSDRCFAVTNEVWDPDPYLLGTPDGTVDLRTGKLRPASQSDCITKLASVGPSEKVDCPIWLAFLNQATRDDKELVAFLKRWFGYCLTGDTREHKLVFAWGPGGNGKGVLMNTISTIFGDYCTTAAMDSFVVTRSDKHTTDMAMLARARLVMTTEVEEGHTWAQAKVNQLTGGDPITARFMRRDNFTYIPQFKLSISGNNKLRLNNVDDAARRRINMVPFVNKPTKPDDTLKERLKAEHPAILRWMINGCLEWQKGGLQPPESVQAATDEYFDAQDYFGRWLDECCIVHPTLEAKPSVALKSFQEWCGNNGEEIVDSRRFHGLVEKADGLRSMVSSTGARVVRGLGLKAPPDTGRYGKDT